MITSCHSEINKIRKNTKFTIALVGNPNVGKSTIFNELTGLGAVTANYPGKTVTLNIGSSKYNGITFGIIDLPGTYSLGSLSEDQFVARREILEKHAEIIVVVIDATNIKRNLYQVVQLIDLGYPLIIACNLLDIAAKQHIYVDINKLSGLLGVTVIPIIATKGEGIEELVKACFDFVEKKNTYISKQPKYNKKLLKYINELSDVLEKNLTSIPYSLSLRALSLLLLEKDEEFEGYIKKDKKGTNLLNKIRDISSRMEKEFMEKPETIIIRERHVIVESISEKVVQTKTNKLSFSSAVWKLTLEPLTGLPILLLGLILIFMIMYFVGGFLSTKFDYFWGILISPHIKNFVYSIFGHGIIARTLLWGVDAGIQSALSVGIPYIPIFYIILAVLEDSGYLNSIAFLSDSLMHKIGLHGRSIIPIISGAGCNVPAIIGTRVLTTKREKIIACTLITLVPCSARTAVIMGAVAFFVGWQWALLIYLINFLVGIMVGRFMSILLPGKSSGLVMEMFPFRAPKLSTILKKTWYRFKEFIIVAIPIITIGSLVLGLLYETKFMWLLTSPMSLIIENWLGLPAVAGICLLFGILRKELALQLLLALAIIQSGPGIHNLLSFMTKQQIFIFALVTTLYIPCIAAISSLIRELGTKTAVAITLFTIVLAVVVGGITNQILNAFHFL